MKHTTTNLARLSAFILLGAGLLAEDITANAGRPASESGQILLAEHPAAPVAQTQAAGEEPNKAAADKLTNSIGMQLRLIKPGSFLMGSTRGDTDEAPVHQVTLTKPFYIGAYEVTQAQYEQIMGSNPSHFRGPQRPVEQVSWNDAQAFCQKLSAQENRSYRLPTEAEWEYACRAGSTTEYYWGSSFYPRYAWSHDNSNAETHDVGQRLPNAWQLFDMSGNVWEWCQDRRGQYSPSGAAETDPTGPVEGNTRALRGGSWYSEADTCRSASRDKNAPDNRHHTFGFRVVLEIN